MPISSKIRSTYEHTTLWAKKYRVEIVASLFGVLAMNLILLAEAYRAADAINPATAGELGDFVGGYVGTGFALFTALLLYRTLRAQRESSQLQSFEARYLELIRLHRDNVAEMREDKVEGRNLFLPMLRELGAAHQLVEASAAAKGLGLTSPQKLQIAYYCIFYGTGIGSSRTLRTSLKDFDDAFLDDLDARLRSKSTRDQLRIDYAIPYDPFKGHQSRLGHYYRHLYQTVKYVDSQTIEIDKYNYVKTIRAQLSTHEQALLLVNSLCPIGSRWWHDGFMLRYRMVKNIPQLFMGPGLGIDLQALFPVSYFEWEELRDAA